MRGAYLFHVLCIVTIAFVLRNWVHSVWYRATVHLHVPAHRGILAQAYHAVQRIFVMEHVSSIKHRSYWLWVLHSSLPNFSGSKRLRIFFSSKSMHVFYLLCFSFFSNQIYFTHFVTFHPIVLLCDWVHKYFLTNKIKMIPLLFYISNVPINQISILGHNLKNDRYLH